jgi:hypothetical protein
LPFFGLRKANNLETIRISGRIGLIGEKRLRLAATHVSNQIQERFSHLVTKGSIALVIEEGTCAITINTKKGISPDEYRQIEQVSNAILQDEAICQYYVDDLILLGGKHNLQTDEGFQGTAREDARLIGQKIYNQLGLAGMRYVCSMFGELWPHTPLMRSLEFAWDGVGEWSA